jgi:hypothetical protein
MTKRWRKAAVTLKVEASEGVFESMAGTDAIEVEGVEFTPNPMQVDTDEVNDSLDPNTPLIGGTPITFAFGFYLKGSGTPGELPDWHDIARACGLTHTATKQTLSGTTFALTNATTLTDSGSGLAVLTVGTVFHITSALGQVGLCIATASAAGSVTLARIDTDAPAYAAFVAETAGSTWTIRYGLAGTAATAGSATTTTLQAPFAATADLYRGMPAWISGNPATPALALINAYSVARVATFAHTFSPVLDNTSKVSIPPHVLYARHSGTIPSASAQLFVDGLRWQMRGLRGNLALTCEAGRTWRAQARFTGLLQGDNPSDNAAPATTIDLARPGVWRQSLFSIDRVTVGLRTMGVDLGNRLEYPANPNDTEGMDPPQIVARRSSFSADPYMTDAATRQILKDLRNGTTRLVAAMQRGAQARQPGNGIGLVLPAAHYTDATPRDAAGFAAEQLAAFPSGRDGAGLQLSVF